MNIEVADRALAVLERIAVALETIADAIVNRKALPSGGSENTLSVSEAVSGVRIPDGLTPEERKKHLAALRAQSYRARVNGGRTLSMPSRTITLPDASSVTPSVTPSVTGSVTERDASVTGSVTPSVTDRHVSSRSSVTRHAGMGGRGGSVLDLPFREDSPISTESGRGEISDRARGDRHAPSRSMQSAPSVTDSVTAVPSVLPPLQKTHRRPITDDGCFGLAVTAWMDGVRSVTKKPYVLQPGTESAHLIELIEAYGPPKDEGRVEWAREKGAEFAGSGARRLNGFAFGDWLKSPDAPSRVQPIDRDDDWKQKKTGKRDGT